MPCIISYKGYRYITSLLKLIYDLNGSEYNIPITFI